MSSRKLKMIHFDCIMRAFEKYLDSQLMPRSIYSTETLAFTRLLAREVKKSREVGQIDIDFGSQSKDKADA